MISAIIIDDEESGRETLDYIVRNHFPSRIQIVGKAASLAGGVALIELQHPHLVFLDVEMPNELGLNIIDHFTNIDFEIVVITAYKNYGIEAIKIGVLDYLLKPVDIDEFAKTVQKIENALYKKRLAENPVTRQNQTSEHQGMSKVALAVNGNKIIFIDQKSILRCEASGNYTTFYFTDHKKEVVIKLIKEVELLLNGEHFFRVQKSHIINVNHIKYFQKNEGFIVMNDDSVVPLSKNIRADFFRFMRIKM